MSERSPSRALRPVQREPGDVSFRTMFGLFALILSLLLVVLGTAYWLFPDQVRDRRFTLPFPDYPDPKLQPSPAVDMSVFRAEQLSRLNGAGWQDKAAGRVHLPIGQAMELIAKEGIPGWPTSPDGRPDARR